MRRLLLVLLPVFAVFLMSHNASAAQRLGNYSGYVSNFNGLPSSGSIINNRTVNLTGTANDLYIANGRFSYTIDWIEGKTYHTSIVVSVDGSGVSFVQPEAIHIDGDYYKTTNDTITSSVACTSSTFCRYTVVHNIDIIATSSGSEIVKTPSSNIINVHSNGNFSGAFMMSTIFFDDDDEWADFKANVSQSLSDISSNTSDTVDILDQIYDRLDVLDSNADANSQAWENMQDTDGLIDVGDNQSFMDSFNSINNFFGGLKNKVAGDCNLDGDLGVMDLGTLNLCDLPQNIKDLVGTITGVVFAIFDILIVWNSIHYIVGLIDWARRN